ncbi:uncharacterized protein LOC126820976 [Patella vulgata]|uniref:uncharacterized protein LOC126820976 n=1 Tax=Patella vulgata TaxID=6465 RepID=UPI0021808104|nr:uncharacterized protein LOC126820976 [Patella vulgata]
MKGTVFCSVALILLDIYSSTCMPVTKDAKNTTQIYNDGPVNHTTDDVLDEIVNFVLEDVVNKNTTDSNDNAVSNTAAYNKNKLLKKEMLLKHIQKTGVNFMNLGKPVVADTLDKLYKMKLGSKYPKYAFEILDGQSIFEYLWNKELSISKKQSNSSENKSSNNAIHKNPSELGLPVIYVDSNRVNTIEPQQSASAQNMGHKSIRSSNKTSNVLSEDSVVLPNGTLNPLKSELRPSSTIHDNDDISNSIDSFGAHPIQMSHVQSVSETNDIKIEPTNLLDALMLENTVLAEKIFEKQSVAIKTIATSQAERSPENLVVESSFKVYPDSASTTEVSTSFNQDHASGVISTFGSLDSSDGSIRVLNSASFHIAKSALKPENDQRPIAKLAEIPISNTEINRTVTKDYATPSTEIQNTIVIETSDYGFQSSTQILPSRVQILATESMSDLEIKQRDSRIIQLDSSINYISSSFVNDVSITDTVNDLSAVASGESSVAAVGEPSIAAVKSSVAATGNSSSVASGEPSMLESLDLQKPTGSVNESRGESTVNSGTTTPSRPAVSKGAFSLNLATVNFLTVTTGSPIQIITTPAPSPLPEFNWCDFLCNVVQQCSPACGGHVSSWS